MAGRRSRSKSRSRSHSKRRSSSRRSGLQCYCVHCKCKRAMRDAQKRMCKNRRYRWAGLCGECGYKVSLLC